MATDNVTTIDPSNIDNSNSDNRNSSANLSDRLAYDDDEACEIVEDLVQDATGAVTEVVSYTCICGGEPKFTTNSKPLAVAYIHGWRDKTPSAKKSGSAKSGKDASSSDKASSDKHASGDKGANSSNTPPARKPVRLRSVI
jgi:hypothetical protein